MPAGASIELGPRAISVAKPPAAKPPLEIDLGAGPKAAPPPVAPASLPVSGGRPALAGTTGPGPSPASPPAAPARLPPRGFPPPDALPEIPIPEKLGKDQVRRVAFIYLGKYEAERDALAKLLDQTAQTVPKKPLFLRRVIYQPVTEDCGGKELLGRLQQAKAVALLGIVEGISEPKLREWGEALAGGGVMFRSVAPLDAGKKSVAIDIVVDVMLLAPEA